MRKRSKRLCSLLMALVMALSLLPTAVFAAEPAEQTYVKVTQKEELVTGKYVLVASNDYALGVLDNGWITAVQPTVDENKIVNPESGVWTLTVGKNGVQLTDAAGKTVAPKGGNANGIQEGTYNWAMSFADGKFQFKGTGEDTVTLASNEGAENKFRAYKNSTASGYPHEFTLYKLEAAEPERESGIVSAADLRNGDTVVIFNPANKKALSTEYKGFSNKDTNVTLADGKLSGYTEADIWTVGINEDGTYTFATSDGGKLSMDTGYASTPLDKVNDAWKIAAAKTDGCYYIQNVGRGNYLEWYADETKWSSYGKIEDGTETLFAQQFYLVVDNGGESPDPEPEPEAGLADGKYIIYNPESGKAMSADATGTYYRAGKDVTVENGKVADPSEDIIWNVSSENGVYTITTADGKKLSMNDEKNSLPLDAANTTWKVEKATTEGCYYIINATRKGNSGDPYYVEWYANTSKGFEEFSTYFYNAANESIYAMQFIPVEQPLVPDGKYVIYNPGSGKAMSADATGTYYRAGKDITVTDGKVTNPAADLIWNVSSQDGVYTITTASGSKLSMNDEKNSLPLDAANTTWKVEEATTEGCYYIINATRKGSSGDPYYVEWYANASKGFEEFSTYFYNAANEGIYAMQFIPAETSVTPPDTGDLPKNGDTVVLYNQSAKGVLAAQDANESPSILGVSAEVKDGKAIPANGGVVFTVEANGEYLRFRNETYGYLCSNGTGNNAFYSKDFSEEGVTTDDADWTVTDCSGGVGGYQMESRTAKFNGKYSQFLEYFSESYKTYSMNKATDYTIYSFFFYPVAEGVSVTGGIVNAPAVDFGTILDAYVGMDYTLSFTVDAVFGVQDLTAKLGEEELTVTKNEDAYAVAIPVAMVTGDKLTVTVSGTDTKGVAFEGIAVIPVKDEPVITNVTPAQGAETGESKRPAISAEIVNAGENASVTMALNGKTVEAAFDGKKITYTPAADMADGKVTVTVTVERADGKKAEKTWSFTVGEAQYQLYFGQLHSHTQYSDGAGSLDSALDYVAKMGENDNVQFVAFTDHSNYFDGSKAGGSVNPEGALYDMSLASTESQALWNSYKGDVEAFNEAHTGELVALAGFEMTWSGGPGHINTFSTPGIVSRNNTTLNNKTADAGLKAYYTLLSESKGANSISQFNHPGSTFGNFIDFSYWDPIIDTRMYLVEVGNGEGQVGAGGYYPSYEQYILALDKGWHVAPTNNQDNHKGRWGNANDARDVILTDDFSEEGIYAALRARRVYATEDKNLEIGYTVNGYQLGSIVSEMPESLTFSVSVYDPDRTDSITKVELVANSGKVIYTWDNAADLAKGELSYTLDDPKYSYYFVRVTEGDGDLAVTAPVWFGETLKLGISTLTSETSMPVTDEPMNLTTTVFNSESTDAAVQSITYSCGDTVLLEKTAEDLENSTIAASGTLELSFPISFSVAKVYTVRATVVIEQNGESYTFTKDIELDVLDAKELLYIGIDASHYNEYVAGNYKDSMGNFAELAGKYSLRTVYLKTSEELVNACGDSRYKILILTAPSRRLADAQADPKTYSAAELAAIKTFNENGGTVILAGWSDNYENYDVIQKNPSIKHMAATQNEVLAALGSHLRISDDATYDDVRSAADGVDKWRLYFSAYNMENSLLDGVEFDPDHPYDKMYTERFSHYGGASIYAVGTDGNPASTLPATVSPVVYGHATTYSVDVDQDGLGGARTPKYAYAENDSRLLVMATEQLEGKGQIIVSGAAFMSNFEVQYQASDSGAEKNYSNYRICENLLKATNSIKVTSIDTVRKQTEEGFKFTVEGTVTSNASGYDADTAFFDCIYVQDETGGINAFPVAGNFKVGDKVRISGITKFYQGEIELNVTSIEKLGEGEAPAPREVTAAQINDKSVLGELVTLRGTVTRYEIAEGKIQTILVRDAGGTVTRVFIDGYISQNKEVQDLKVGCNITVTGLASWDDTFTLDGKTMEPRIRIRDRADVVCTAGGGVTPVTPVTPTQPGLPFTDVSKGEWYYDGVNALYRRGIMDGTTETLFAPSQGLSRGQLAMIFYRMAGEPEVTAKDTYSDVPAGLWCAKAVTWASANGLVLGYEDGTFRPDQPVQRQQLVAMLFRYAAFCGMSAVTLEENLLSFQDVGAVSGYARPAMNWAVGQGILLGSENYLMPREQATRAQVAMVLHRYLTLLG